MVQNFGISDLAIGKFEKSISHISTQFNLGPLGIFGIALPNEPQIVTLRFLPARMSLETLM